MSKNSRAVRQRVGRNVQRLRKARGLSQERLAEQAGNTGKHIGQVERGEVNVGIDVLTAIADYFAIPVATLFGPDPRRGAYLIPPLEFDALKNMTRIVARIERSNRRRRK